MRTGTGDKRKLGNWYTIPPGIRTEGCDNKPTVDQEKLLRVIGDNIKMVLVGFLTTRTLSGVWGDIYAEEPCPAGTLALPE